MRALIVSDIHSNLEAFESVVEDAERRGGFDQIWSLGDLVGYGPDPRSCIDLMRRHDHSGVAGNHDLASIGKLSLEEFNRHAAGANRWTATQLTDEHVAYLGGLELKLELDEFTIVHGSPRDPVWEYVASVDTAVANFSHFDTSRCLVGHTHIPFICRQVGDDRAIFLRFSLDAPVKLSTHRLIINPGGVGQPRDGDPRASYAVYDSESQAVVHHRVDYDIPATQQKMRQHGLPKFLIERLVYGH